MFCPLLRLKREQLQLATWRGKMIDSQKLVDQCSLLTAHYVSTEYRLPDPGASKLSGLW